MKEDQIIKSLREGKNGKVLKTLYKAFPAIRSFIKENGGTAEDAKDVFQDSLMVLHKNAVNNDDFKLTCSVNTYLFKICKYMWKDLLTQKNKVVHFEFETKSDEVDEETVLYIKREEQFKQLDEMLLTIGKKCLELLTNYYIKKMSMKQIAEAMNYSSVNSAKTSKYKCIERAKKMII